MSIADEIQQEREYQNQKWGGNSFDDDHTINDWVAFINTYSGQACKTGLIPKEQREQLLKVASLAVAAIEAFDRNGSFPLRHYGE